MLSDTPIFDVSGTISKKDAKRMTQAMRGSTIGPTTLYYAGVTAPVIGASMALMSAAALGMTPLSEYWQTMLAAILAAVAGICWYLIFIRWSYRQSHGRAAEIEQETHVSLESLGVIIRRGAVETRIGWLALQQVKIARGYTLLRFNGADPLIVPDKWFKKDKEARKAFQARLKQGHADHGAREPQTVSTRAEPEATARG